MDLSFELSENSPFLSKMHNLIAPPRQIQTRGLCTYQSLDVEFRAYPM